MASASDVQPPKLAHLMREAGALAMLRCKCMLPVRRPALRLGAGRPVMVIPGFLAGDHSTAVLRRTLAKAGFRVQGWGLGANLGARADLLDRLEAQLDCAARDGPVTLIGWSLGGIYAREVAKRRPDRVVRVITLGTPFSGDLRANNAWRLYELINDHKVDEPPIEVTLGEKPPVPTLALWSRRDGIVAPASARGGTGECDEAVEVDCSHMGFVSSRRALEALLEALA